MLLLVSDLVLVALAAALWTKGGVGTPGHWPDGDHRAMVFLLGASGLTGILLSLLVITAVLTHLRSRRSTSATSSRGLGRVAVGVAFLRLTFVGGAALAAAFTSAAEDVYMISMVLAIDLGLGVILASMARRSTQQPRT